MRTRRNSHRTARQRLQLVALSAALPLATLALPVTHASAQHASGQEAVFGAKSPQQVLELLGRLSPPGKVREKALELLRHMSPPGRVTEQPAEEGIHIIEHPTPSKRGPIDIKLAPDGNLYFSYFGNRMGELNLQTKQLSDIDVPFSTGTPYAVNGGPGNAMWITSLYGYGYGNDIARVDLSTHKVDSWEIPTPYSYAADLKTGQDGALWFTETRSDKIGRFDPQTHKIEEISVGIQGAAPQDVAVPWGQGLIWWADQGPNGNALQSIDPFTRQMNTYKFPTPNAGVLDIDPGPDGHSVWFAEMFTNKIGVFDTQTHQMREFDVPTPNSVPLTLAAGPDGAMYFNEALGSKVGRIDLNTFQITEFPTPTPNALPLDISAESPPGWPPGYAKHGNMFFAEGAGNNIGELVIPPSSDVK